MKYYNSREFKKILKNNGYKLERVKGSHYIYKKGKSEIVIPLKLNTMIARRLIKENQLVLS